ncbi:MAG: VOC family protein [Betaproteobacteria bacterium]
MPEANFVILYVESPAASVTFYEDLLGRPPIESSPTFAMFTLHGESMLGLWSRSTVEPLPAAAPGGSEIGLTVDRAATVDAVHDDWHRRGIVIAQPPTTMDFGRTFVALDPDGHRLRVFAQTGR